MCLSLSKLQLILQRWVHVIKRDGDATSSSWDSDDEHQKFIQKMNPPRELLGLGLYVLSVSFVPSVAFSW